MRGIAAAVVLIAGVLALGAGEAQASLPDWVQAVADAAPPAPATLGAPFRILLSETRLQVQPDGAVRIRRRLATQALSVRTDEVDTGYFHVGGDSYVSATRAWHLPPGEKGARSRTTPIDLSLDEAFLSDNKVRAVRVEGVKKGSLVFFEFEAVQHPVFLSVGHLFYEGGPVALDRFSVEIPAGWTLKPVWLRGGAEPAASGSVSTWELKDLPGPPADEPLADEPADRAPLLIVHVKADARLAHGPATFTGWPEVSTWYEDLAKGRDQVTPEIETARRRLGAASEGTFDRIRAAATFVRDSVRYTAIELGVGGFQPRPAKDTLANLYGDCKDKGTLLQALLSADGIPSYPVLIKLGGADAVSDAVPVWGFNHFIVAVPLSEGLEVPPAYRGAIADGADLGRLLFLDPTDDRTSVGSISSALAGHRGLVVAGERGRLVALPAGDPDAHRIERRTEIALQPDGSAVVRRSSRLAGEFAARARAELGRSAEERRRALEHGLESRWPGASLQSYDVQPEDASGAFQETVAVALRPTTVLETSALMPLHPWVGEELPRAPLGTRTSDVVYPHPLSVRDEVRLTGVTAEVGLPAPVRLEGEGWSVTSTASRDAGGAVEAVVEIRLARTRFAASAFPELRRLWSAVSTAAQAAVPRRPEGS